MHPALASYHSSLPDAAAAGVPDWVHLLPAGTFSGRDGRGPFHLRDAAAVIAASMQAGKLAIDENHSTDLAAPAGMPSPAKGWIVEMQAREADGAGAPAGIWGRVEWNDAGRSLMAERAYSGISPVFVSAKDGTILSILRAALTNTPNLSQLASLNATEKPTLDIQALRTALGLPDTAADADILTAAAAARQAQVSLHSQQPETERMAATVVQLQTQLSTLQAQIGRDRAAAAIDAAIADGKPIAALRDHYIARHMADPEAVTRELAGLPSINAGGVVLNARKEPDAMSSLTDEDRMTCQRMGLDPVKFAEHKRKLAAGEGSAV